MTGPSTSGPPKGGLLEQRWFWPASIWVMFGLVLLGGVLRKGRAPASSATQATKSPQGVKTTRVAIVLSVGGRGDQSFNDSAYEGLMQAKKLFRHVAVRFSEPRVNAAAKRDLTHFAREGYDLIIGVGFLMARALADVAAQYPKSKFAIIDAVVTKPNVASLVFQEHEGSYLAGVLAALATRTNTVAFLGGMEIPLIRKFEAGFRQGVHDTRPKAKVLVGYIGASPSAFHDAPGGRRLATTQFGSGADIIFHAAGSSGMGAIKAAQAWNKRHPKIAERRYIIGVDGNQDAIAKGSVLTSMVKRVDVAVFEIIKLVLQGRFQPRIYRYGLPEGGVGVTDCRYALKRLPTNFRQVLAKKRAEIIAGKVNVPHLPERVRKPSGQQPAPRPTAPSPRRTSAPKTKAAPRPRQSPRARPAARSPQPRPARPAPRQRPDPQPRQPSRAAPGKPNVRPTRPLQR